MPQQLSCKQLKYGPVFHFGEQRMCPVEGSAGMWALDQEMITP
jgi:hypothetical protein